MTDYKPWEKKHFKNTYECIMQANVPSEYLKGLQDSAMSLRKDLELDYTLDEVEKTHENMISKCASDIRKNHHKILDDWCKAYLSQRFIEGKSIDPGYFTLVEQVPTFDEKNQCMVQKFWFEDGIPKFEKEKKVLKDCLPDADALFRLGNKIQSLREQTEKYFLNYNSIHCDGFKLLMGIIDTLDSIRLACYGNSKDKNDF